MLRKPVRGFLALGLFLLVLCSMPVQRTRGECLSGLCVPQQCTEYCCGEPYTFYHKVLDPSPYMEADKQWTYIYKDCPGPCEDTYPSSKCTYSGCQEIQ